MSLWSVVGGEGKGGILVREGQALGSPATKDRLSTGATIKELQLVGERLHYELVDGTGPQTGWVSLKISGKDLVVEKEEDVDWGGPGEEGGDVEVDADLKENIAKNAAAYQKDDAFGTKFCFKYKTMKYPVEKCKLRIFCFHNAGSTESGYTKPNTPFTKWAKEAADVEICAIDFPGRDKMLKEDKHTSTDTLAPVLLAVMSEKMTDGIPYMVWGHSVGTWVCFEFLVLARKVGLPMPVAACLNAFPAPHMPAKERRWHKSARLDEKGLKEELMNWDKAHFTGPGKVAFEDSFWNGPTGSALMRADFRLYDEYVFKHGGAPKFDFPIQALHMEDEHYNLPNMIEMWGSWTTKKFDYKVMKGIGHLNCFYNPEKMAQYFTEVVGNIKEVYGSL